MAYLLDHMQMVSLRGKEYVFNLEGGMPDWREEPSRQLYMDSFILFALPVDSDTVGTYRLKGMKTVLEHLTRNRYQWLHSGMFSLKVDHVMWTDIFSAYMPGQPKPKFPWKVPELSSLTGLPSFVYKAWRTGMGLTCGYPSLKDETSTELALSNVSRMSTEERVRSFLEYERLEQWCTTRGVMPVKQKQTQLVESEEGAQWPPELGHWSAAQEGETVQAAVAKSPMPPKETPLLSGCMGPDNLEELVTLKGEVDALVDVLRHIAHVRAKQSGPAAEILVALTRMHKKNPILRYMQGEPAAAPPREEVERDLHLGSGLSRKTVLDLLQCETMMSTIWTFPDFHLLAGPVSMRASRKGGFLVDEGEESSTMLTNRAFLEWEGSGSLEAIINALVTPTPDTHGRCRPYLSARPDIIQVTVGSVKADVRPPRELDVWIGCFRAPGVYSHQHYTQHYLLVGVVSISCEGRHTSSFCDPIGYGNDRGWAPGQKDLSTIIISKETSGLLMYAASAPWITKDSVAQRDQPLPPKPLELYAMLAEFEPYRNGTALLGEFEPFPDKRTAATQPDYHATQHQGNSAAVYTRGEQVGRLNDGRKAPHGEVS
ncbi:unnamed protein product [Clonostachys solani]|uniref:Rhodanese domain-containing protein n=1 Tax=Clonostachys solani TaxID=160281 RepID=A0A9N9VZ19_9HYPO|nr:unnamed protein product [Clonostachys solani]